MLEDLIATCTNINEKISGAFLKELEIIKYLEGPQLIRDYMVTNK